MGANTNAGVAGWGRRDDGLESALRDASSDDDPFGVDAAFSRIEQGEDEAQARPREVVPVRLAPAPRAAEPLVLVVLDGLEEVAAVCALLECTGFTVGTVADMSAALTQVRTRAVPVVLAALVQERGSGLGLAESLALTCNETQLLLSVGTRPRAAVLRRFEELRNTRLIARNASLDGVVSAVGFRGSLFGVSLVDLLQLLHHGRRTATLRLVVPAAPGPFGARSVAGALHFLKGELVHAECEGATGLEALQLILRWRHGTLQLCALSTRRCSIEQRFDALVLDTLRRIDEAAAGPQPVLLRPGARN